jgi:uncharacterized protein (TIGR02466 family)
MSAGAKVTSLFETPVVVDRLPDANALNGHLRGAIAENRKTSPGVVKSNKLGWQSDTLMLRWGGEGAYALARHFLSLCEKFTADPRPKVPGQKPFLWLLDMWANVSPPGGSNDYHSHPGAVWSGVYYVDDGYGGADGSNLGGELVFEDPRMPMARMMPLDLRYRAPDGSVYEGHHEVRPSAGTMVMFPSWLRHSVRPYLGTGERISIAINATAYQPSN